MMHGFYLLGESEVRLLVHVSVLHLIFFSFCGAVEVGFVKT